MMTFCLLLILLLLLIILLLVILFVIVMQNIVNYYRYIYSIGNKFVSLKQSLT